MNTIRSTWIGWGALCVAGGGAYVFAKRSVNADRATRFESAQKRKEEAARLEKMSSSNPHGIKPPIPVPPVPSATSASETRQASSAYGGGIADASPHQYRPPTTTHPRTSAAGTRQTPDDVANPSQEGGHDPAPTRHEPDTEAERVAEKGKYEATEPYKSRKGNRLS